MKKIYYSQLAYEEGFDFSSLPMEQQKMTHRLYGGVECMDHLYQACISYNEYIENALSDQDMTCTWRFPDSGQYMGIILSCQRSWKPYSPDYVIRFLVNRNWIELIKFRTHYDDPIYNAIRELIGHHTGETPNFSNICGRMALITIENITGSTIRKYDRPFSVVREAKILSDEEDSTVCAMFQLMLEQCDQGEETNEDA